jgi:hypothetical protein
MPEIVIDTLHPADWPQVRTIYLEGIATGQATFEQQRAGLGGVGSQALARVPPRRQGCGRAGRRLGRADALLGAGGLCWRGRGEHLHRRRDARAGRGAPAAGGVGGRVRSRRHLDVAGRHLPENTASVRLHERCGFRVVGRRQRIGQLHGVWRDVLLLERRSASVGV